jgi:predicted GIY-YIG superfamily endonuclease
MQFYGYIYRVTCTTNGKAYIGQTTQEPEERWALLLGLMLLTK